MLRVAVQPIRLFGDPVLRRPAVEVVDFDKELRTLVAEENRRLTAK
jgi:peptide deformylase